MCNRSRQAFTIVEMLIAMAVTLLMMVALGKMFQSVGRGMQDSRANVEMSARLRTITFRLKDELSRCTANMTPPHSAGEGAGYLVYYDGPVTDATTMLFTNPSSLPDDQLIDYRPTSKFGDYDDYLAFTAVAEGDAYFTGVIPDYLQNPSSPTPLKLVTTTSKYAEIVYWLQPVRDTAGVIIDRDNDLLPDRMNLHRRVLLIRPDLNNAAGVLPLALPIPSTNPSGTNVPMVMRQYDPSTIASTGSPQYFYNQGWPANYRQVLEVYQDCDLSIRRNLTSSGLPDGPNVSANSLDDLTLPHNRFAHVRIPGGTGVMSGVGTSTTLTSMPILDLAGPDTYVKAAEVNGLLGRRVELTSGFLSADYSLRGVRLGEDIVLPGVTAFDVKAFDAEAPVLIHVGADGRPGSSGSAIVDYGMLGSDDVVLTPSDPGFGTALRGTSAATTSPFDSMSPWSFVVGSTGAFVDLDYVYKAAGPTRAPGGVGGPLGTNILTFCNTPFSGFDGFGGAGTFRFPSALAKSGCYIPNQVVAANAPTYPNADPQFYQPVFDTYADDYEFDGFNQAPDPSGSSSKGTVWYARPATVTPAILANIDEGNDGLDSNNANGVDDDGERETSPPMTASMRALQVQIRIEDQSTRQSRQMTVTQEFVQ
ncbi:prepilin-type N-terminal cleavage/methylation domain-containing protein [Roseimaritima ulvae]|nr:prepilin-type N-terminal cleavage/methylation domain-containing protein [Roseimaritima ulvae]